MRGVSGWKTLENVNQGLHPMNMRLTTTHERHGLKFCHCAESLQKLAASLNNVRPCVGGPSPTKYTSGGAYKKA